MTSGKNAPVTYALLEEKFGPTGACKIADIAQDFLNAGHGVSVTKALSWAIEQYEAVMALVQLERLGQ